MGTKGPCFHCGIEDSPIWRTGPPEQPVLCNVCGSRWGTSGTLDGYIQEDAKNDQISQPNLCAMLNPTSSVPISGVEKKNFFGANITGNHGPSFTFGSTVVRNDQAPFVFGARIYPGSSSQITVSKRNTQTQNVEEAIQAPLLETNNIPRKKKSTFQQVVSPTERLYQQLYIAMEEQSDVDEEDPESLLIFERINKYIPENEIGLGCMLLKPPPSLEEDSKKEPKAMSSIGVKTPNVAPSHAKDSELPIENSSGFLTRESFKDDTSSKSEPLATSIKSKREPRINNPQHHMVTRSKAKNRDAYKLLKDIGSPSPSEEDQVEHLNRRPQVAFPHKKTRGRQRKSQGQGTGNSMFPQDESKIDPLTDDLNDGPNITVSGLTDEFTFLEIQEMQTMEVEERKTSETLGIKPWEGDGEDDQFN